MPFSNYTLRRAGGLFWKWEANFRDEVSAHGYSLTRGGARSSARGWLQTQGVRRSAPRTVEPSLQRPGLDD
jgi:hypothetical protein